MNLDRLKWSVFEFLGIGCTATQRADFPAMLMTKYFAWFEEPLIGSIYRLGWSDRKPIALIELDDMFDLEDLGLRRGNISRNS
jgi:hypothetical protein